jgi:sugar phosphate isomerase/epimerase
MNLNGKYIPLTLSSNTLGKEIDFKKRVEIASKIGFEGIGLSAEAYILALKQGYSDCEMLNILITNNIRVTEIECITNWTEQRKSVSNRETDFYFFKEQTIFHMARLFNVKSVNCGVSSKVSLQEHIQDFKELCKRAENLIVALEFMPYSGVPTIGFAYDVLEKAGCDNSMLILDAWHWNRSKQTSTELKNIPSCRIVSIQICDVLERAYPTVLQRKESLHDRLSPGYGFGDTLGFIKMIKDHGIAPDVISVEVMSDNLLNMGIEESVEINYAASISIIERAWPELLS